MLNSPRKANRLNKENRVNKVRINKVRINKRNLIS